MFLTELALVRLPSITLEQFIETRYPIDQHIADEHQVIEAEDVDGEGVLCADLEGVAHKHLHADRNVAHPDEAAEMGVAMHGFGHHAGRIGEVDEPGIR